MWSALRNVFMAARSDPVDPREPDCPRTPMAQWTHAHVTQLDPRSPTLGVARSPLRVRAERASYTSRDSVARLQEATVDSDTAAESSTFEFRSLAEGNEICPTVAATVAAPSGASVAAIPAPVNVDEELAKLRLEFSLKKADKDKQDLHEAPNTPVSEAKAFLASPALWRTIAQSSPAFGTVKTPEAQALLQRPAWESPQMRRALFRHDSASAA